MTVALHPPSLVVGVGPRRVRPPPRSSSCWPTRSPAAGSAPRRWPPSPRSTASATEPAHRRARPAGAAPSRPSALRGRRRPEPERRRRRRGRHAQRGRGGRAARPPVRTPRSSWPSDGRPTPPWPSPAGPAPRPPRRRGPRARAAAAHRTPAADRRRAPRRRRRRLRPLRRPVRRPAGTGATRSLRSPIGAEADRCRAGARPGRRRPAGRPGVLRRRRRVRHGVAGARARPDARRTPRSRSCPGVTAALAAGGAARRPARPRPRRHQPLRPAHAVGRDRARACGPSPPPTSPSPSTTPGRPGAPGSSNGPARSCSPTARPTTPVGVVTDAAAAGRARRAHDPRRRSTRPPSACSRSCIVGASTVALDRRAPRHAPGLPLVTDGRHRPTLHGVRGVRGDVPRGGAAARAPAAGGRSIDRCTGCFACIEVCPVDAIRGDAVTIHPIEVESYRIMDGGSTCRPWPPLGRAVVARMIHASADLDYATSARSTDGAVRGRRRRRASRRTDHV